MNILPLVSLKLPTNFCLKRSVHDFRLQILVPCRYSSLYLHLAVLLYLRGDYYQSCSQLQSQLSSNRICYLLKSKRIFVMRSPCFALQDISSFTSHSWQHSFWTWSLHCQHRQLLPSSCSRLQNNDTSFLFFFLPVFSAKCKLSSLL